MSYADYTRHRPDEPEPPKDVDEAELFAADLDDGRDDDGRDE